MRHAAPLLGVLLAVHGIATGQTVDGSVCYKARDSAPKGTYTVTAGGQTCRIKTPARMACLTERNAPIMPAPPASSTVDPAPPELCYRARCRPRATRPATLADAFGSRGVTLRAGRFLCLPAGGAETIVTTTTVPGGVTTTTRPERECGFEDGHCGGGCPSQAQRCSVASDGCKCRATTCGNADAPSCEGSCPRSNEACVYAFTGCECVEIP